MMLYPLFQYRASISPVLCQELAYGLAVLQGHVSAAKYLGGVLLLLGATTVCSGVVGNRSNRSFGFFFFSGISRQCFLGNCCSSLAHLPFGLGGSHMLLEGKREDTRAKRLV